MFANLDNNTLLLIIMVVLVFLYLTMDNKENMKSISSKKRGGLSSRAAGKVSDKKISEDVAPVVEGYINGYY
jgi:short subunit fatty acids transporter